MAIDLGKVDGDDWDAAAVDAMEAEINLKFATPGAWGSWIPTVLQPGALAATVHEAGYQRIGRLIIASGLVTVTASGTANTAMVLSVPVAVKAGISSNYSIIGSGSILHAGNRISFDLYWLTNGTCRAMVTGTPADGNYLGLTGSPVGQLVNGNIISWKLCYEANT